MAMNDGCSPLPFTLRQLQYLVAIEETGGFSRAAAYCRVSQPSLSAQVAQLEETLGVQIFERARRGVAATREGQRLLKLARDVLDASSNLEQAAESERDPWSGIWQFGIIPTLAPFVLPTLAPSLSSQHPALRVVWREATTPQLVEDLRTGRLEAAVLALEADLGPLATHPLRRDPFLLAVPRSHSLAEESGPASLDALDGERLLLLEDGHCLRTQALEVCRRDDEDTEGFAATSFVTLVEMVAVGLGVTLIPAIAAETVSRDSRVVLRPLESPMPFRTIGLACRAGSVLNAQFEEVAKLFSKSLEDSSLGRSLLDSN